MNQEQKIEELEKQIKWNKKHLRIVFLMSTVALLMLVGHFILHATGKV
ncbi:MAG: hypothetical protein HRT58_20995 [Crocinitomicaceae bacterium]|nr:hypothetical protein [Flavobacteriales bacterium]NQZ38149.1 hypothetical protein [Crocinitomicaceae bacterium]